MCAYIYYAHMRAGDIFTIIYISCPNIINFA